MRHNARAKTPMATAAIKAPIIQARTPSEQIVDYQECQYFFGAPHPIMAAIQEPYESTFSTDVSASFGCVAYDPSPTHPTLGF